MLSRKGEMKCEPNTNIIRASVTIDFVKKKLSEKKKDISKQVFTVILFGWKNHYIPFNEKLKNISKIHLTTSTTFPKIMWVYLSFFCKWIVLGLTSVLI